MRDKVSKALTHIGQFGLFEEYTKHDIGHIDAMLDTYDWLIPSATKDAMTPAEWLMLTLATYLHDFGMLVTRDEYSNRHSTDFPAFVAKLASSPRLDDRDYESHLDSLGAEARDRFLYQEFVRTNHPARIRSWLSETPDPRLGFDERVCDLLRDILGSVEPAFIDDLGLVCESHHHNDLDDTNRYPTDKPYGRTPAEAANLQYIAILLRAADLLHMTRDRTPAIAFRVINPKNPISLLEWAKQQKVRAVRPQRVVNAEPDGGPNTSPDTIEVHATFTEGKAYFGLTSYLLYATQELKRCSTWARESISRAGVPHAFPWTKVDLTHVAAKGFVAKQFEFRLDQHKVLDLLTGHTLYNDTSVVVRELVQNSIDAVRLQQIISNSPEYTPTVVVKWNAVDRVMEVVDNGTGMTERTINENFLHVGASRYQSDEFRRTYPDFSSISRFGIGVLSAFMISDDVRVITSHSDESEVREISLESVHGQYLMRLLAKNSPEVPPEIKEHGTAIRVRVRETAALRDLGELLRFWVVVPGCELYFETDDRRERIGFASTREALESSVREVSNHVRLDSNLEVRSAVYAGFEIAYVVEWHKWYREYALVGIPGRERHAFDTGYYQLVLPQEVKVNPLSGTLIEGIRVTDKSPAMSEGGVWALANATGLSAPRTNVARTALERGPEYNDFVDNTFRAYVEHVQTEVNDMHLDRGLSLTRAVFEAPFIAQPFLDPRNARPEDLSAHVRAQESLPMYVVEDKAGRRIASLRDLASLGELATVDNQIVEGFDSLLSSLPKSMTMRQIFDIVGDHAVSLPDRPILRLGRSHNFARLFRNHFEVRQIKARDHSDVECQWASIDHREPRWVGSLDVRARQLRSYRPVREFSLGSAVWAPLLEIPYEGPGDVSAVRIVGNIHLLANHPALRIKAAHDDIPAWMVPWFACVLVGAYMSRDYGYHRDSNPEASKTSILLSSFTKSGLHNYFELNSVVEALEAMPTQILDPRNSWRPYQEG
ncbi:ATP-binding protein [Micromonospora harpali]|uniref:HD domain-containing protein n=1 Tax=Micromonospora harpali TaxID=1490225 RepID=UPI00338EA738